MGSIWRMQSQLWRRCDHENQTLYHSQVFFLCIYVHINMPVYKHKHSIWAKSLLFIVRPWHTQTRRHTQFPPMWIKRWMCTDCILIVKECLEVTRTWACLTSKADCREGPFHIKRAAFCWVLPLSCWEWTVNISIHIIWLKGLKSGFKKSRLLQMCFFKAGLKCASPTSTVTKEDRVMLPVGASLHCKYFVHSCYCWNPADMLPHVTHKVICIYEIKEWCAFYGLVRFFS